MSNDRRTRSSAGRATMLFLGLAMSAGCFVGCTPVDLDVNGKGEMIVPREDGFFLYHPATGKVTQLRDVPEGQPVCARFAPSGTEVLVVVKFREEGRFKDEYRCELLPLAGGKGRTILTAPGVGNPQFSPDGKQLAVLRCEDESAELHLVDVASGKGRLLLKNVGHHLRWFSDSKRLLVFRVAGLKDGKIAGEPAECEADTGRLTPLASLLTDRTSSLDLSPDNKKAIFSALASAPVGMQAVLGESSKPSLFELDIAARRGRSLPTQAFYVRYSPTGRKILLTRPGKEILGTKQELVVADAGLSDFKVVASDSYAPVISYRMEAELFPGWLDDQRLFLFTERMVYGSAGKAIHMVLIGADGGGRKYVQPDIDLGVEKAKAAAKP